MKKITLSILCIVFTFYLNAQTTVNCTTGPVNTTYCYGNNDTTSFQFISSDGTVNCSDNNYTPWDFNVSCNTCTNPSVAYAVIDDCDTSGGFFVDVNISNLGSASSLTVSDNQSSATQNVSTTGTIQFGPYSNNTDVIISIQNDQDVNCQLNSTALSQSDCPPPAPNGVTCASGSSTFIFTEEFNSSGSWTGDINSGNGSWEIPDGSSSPDTGPNAAFSGSNYMNFEASGNSSATASAVSPAIDLTPAIDGAELSFYMHAYGDDMGTLNVNVGTSASGPFTTLYSFSGELQTSGLDSWIPVGINLDAYLGSVIYIEFNHTGTGTGFQGDMSIDLMRIETCGSFCIAPTNLSAANITSDSAGISWTAGNNETAWEYVVQNAGLGVPTGSGTPTASSVINVTGLNPMTSYDVCVRSDCGVDGFSSWNCYSFTTGEDLSSYPITFTSTSVATSGAFDIALVDLNGDFLDDIVSVSSSNINVHYQLATGGFNAVNIGTTAADNSPSWSLAAGDFDRNGYNDLLYGGGNGVTFMKANASGTGYTEVSYPDYVFSQRSNFIDEVI